MADKKYILYCYDYSICSIMVRYSLAIRGKPADNGADITVEERQVDVAAKLEQYTEDFLCNVNPKGQVPVLAGGPLEKPLAESIAITQHLADLFPSLMPESRREQITHMLKELHGINFFSLSFTGQTHVSEAGRQKIQQLLQQGDISPRFRTALEQKLKALEDGMMKSNALEPGVVQSMVDRTRRYMEVVQGHLPGHASSAGGPWLFGLPHPSALDAHFVTFVARLQDVSRDALIPEDVKRYADQALRTAEWKGIMQGRRTM